MSAYFKISNTNSIRFAERSASTLKTDYNSLSSEDINNFSYKEVQKFGKETITTQFRSSYDYVFANLIDENDVSTALTVTKKTTNFGRQHRLDGLFYNYKGEGVYTALYFLSGNTYTYGTSTIIGTHSLNGELPEFGIIGESVWVDGEGTSVISRIVYDEDVDAMVLLILETWSVALPTAPDSAQMQSDYDIADYEVYEFDADFSALSNLSYVTVKNRHLTYPTISLQSELLDIQTTHEKTLNIVYYNEVNSDIMYSTGITHKLIVPYDKIKASDENENEYNITDTTAILIDSEIKDKNTFYFSELSTEVLRKLKIALSSKIVIINNEGYISDGTLNEESVENTNLYTLEAVMIKTGVNYYSEPITTSDEAASAFIARGVAGGATVENVLCIFDTYDNNY